MVNLNFCAVTSLKALLKLGVIVPHINALPVVVQFFELYVCPVLGSPIAYDGYYIADVDCEGPCPTSADLEMQFMRWLWNGAIAWRSLIRR